MGRALEDRRQEARSCTLLVPCGRERSVHIQIAGAPRVVRLSGLVLRCGVAGISADGVVYVGALKFDTPCDLSWPERFKKE